MDPIWDPKSDFGLKVGRARNGVKLKLKAPAEDLEGRVGRCPAHDGACACRQAQAEAEARGLQASKPSAPWHGYAPTDAAGIRDVVLISVAVGTCVSGLSSGGVTTDQAAGSAAPDSTRPPAFSSCQNSDGILACIEL